MHITVSVGGSQSEERKRKKKWERERERERERENVCEICWVQRASIFNTVWSNLKPVSCFSKFWSFTFSYLFLSFSFFFKFLSAADMKKSAFYEFMSKMLTCAYKRKTCLNSLSLCPPFPCRIKGKLLRKVKKWAPKKLCWSRKINFTGLNNRFIVGYQGL